MNINKLRLIADEIEDISEGKIYKIGNEMYIGNGKEFKGPYMNRVPYVPHSVIHQVVKNNRFYYVVTTPSGIKEFNSGVDYTEDSTLELSVFNVITDVVREIIKGYGIGHLEEVNNKSRYAYKSAWYRIETEDIEINAELCKISFLGIGTVKFLGLWDKTKNDWLMTDVCDSIFYGKNNISCRDNEIYRIYNLNGDKRVDLNYKSLLEVSKDIFVVGESHQWYDSILSIEKDKVNILIEKKYLTCGVYGKYLVLNYMTEVNGVPFINSDIFDIENRSILNTDYTVDSIKADKNYLNLTCSRLNIDDTLEIFEVKLDLEDCNEYNGKIGTYS